MDPAHLEMAKHLLLALAAGSVIGIERSLHGRPAGFRTHALVCLASSLLMLLPVLEARWVPQGAGDSVRLDPTRMAQGIMTGIGFLGAGVIFKDGLTVRGLTTAASIWITAAIGVMIGSGLYYPAGIATVLTLGVLSVFRRVESLLPSHQYAQLRVGYEREHMASEAELREAVKACRCKVSGAVATRLEHGGKVFEYRLTVRATGEGGFHRLSEALPLDARIKEFSLSPEGE